MNCADRSKSLSEIPVEQAVQKVQFEDLQKFRAQVKENEDKWQDVSTVSARLLCFCVLLFYSNESLTRVQFLYFVLWWS